MSNQIKKRKEIADGARALAEGNEKHQYFCEFCRKDISGVVRIRCAECKDFDLCLECFSVGVEVHPHVNTHKYRVMYHVTTPIFDEGWGADEELLLLEGIEQCGFGNWVDIAEHIGTKSKEECERHYEDVYLENGGDPPLPSLEFPIKPKAAPIPSTPGSQENYNGSKAGYRQGSLGAMLGYLPKRNDYDSEWENDAERVVADMEFKPTDNERETELKLEMMRWYGTILDGRWERKQFVMYRNLLEREKRKNKDDKEFMDQLQVFGRFLPQEDFEKFVEGMKVEASLRKEISNLQLYIRNGLRSKQEIDAYNYERKRRAASSNTLGIENRRKAIMESDGSEMLSAQEKDIIKELGLTVTTYLKLKQALVIEDAQNRNLPDPKMMEHEGGKHPKKKHKTTGGMRLRIEPAPVVIQTQQRCKIRVVVIIRNTLLNNINISPIYHF